MCVCRACHTYNLQDMLAENQQSRQKIRKEYHFWIKNLLSLKYIKSIIKCFVYTALFTICCNWRLTAIQIVKMKR